MRQDNVGHEKSAGGIHEVGSEHDHDRRREFKRPVYGRGVDECKQDRRESRDKGAQHLRTNESLIIDAEE